MSQISEKDVQHDSGNGINTALAQNDHAILQDDDPTNEVYDAQKHPKGLVLAVILFADALAVFLVCLAYATHPCVFMADTRVTRSRWT